MTEPFMWGNSTSSIQTEGTFAGDGKGPSVYDVVEATENTSDWQVAIDDYHRYEEDIQLMKEMGMNAYRFQISWSRIFPNGDGEVNEKGLAFYDKLIDCLLSNGIEPMICLYHFDMPLVLSEQYQGFSSKQVVDDFFNYAKLVIDRYHEKVKYWITFNEHNLYSTDLAFKIAGDNVSKDLRSLYQIQYNTLLAHAKVEHYIHAHYPDVQIGGMLAYTTYYPKTSKPEDNYLSHIYDDFNNKVYLDVFNGKGYLPTFMQYLKRHEIILDTTEDEWALINGIQSDFISFSYYQSQTVEATEDPYNPLTHSDLVDNPYLERSAWNWEIDPMGLKIAMLDIYNRTNLPVFIIENGIGIRETLPEDEWIADDERIHYHKAHIEAMLEAMGQGVPCLGYLGWGLIDILSSSGDMEKRYGAVFVNRTNQDLKDLRRIKKKSFYYLKQVFESNGKETEIK
ncbi:MAG: glycoside hydrolase family 1 protein [Aerococcus sp.]|nr:glycoside hydrolase family 1 protein [Aerococcus sp.]